MPEFSKNLSPGVFALNGFGNLQNDFFFALNAFHLILGFLQTFRGNFKTIFSRLETAVICG